MQWYSARIRKTFQRLAVSHAVQAASREQTVEFNIASELGVEGCLQKDKSYSASQLRLRANF